MNLALKDFRHNVIRFGLTTLGVALLFAATIGMVGMYRGIIFEALIIIDGIGADLWVVEGGRAGPFAESSLVPATLDRRIEGVQGVTNVRRFISYNQQFLINDRLVRFSLTGLDYPKDTGAWLPITEGRPIKAPHYELIADRSSGLTLGDKVRMEKNDYTVVAITDRQVDMAGDAALFVTIPDAQAISRTLPSEGILLNRAARGLSRMGMPNAPGAQAVILNVKANTSAIEIKEKISRWGDVSVLTRAEQHAALLDGRLFRLRLQILAFATMTLVICCAVIAMTIYTMPLEKLQHIALLKLIGAKDRTIIKMIATQALLIASTGIIIGYIIALYLYPNFPRLVLLQFFDIVKVSFILLLLSLFASLFAIQKALKVRAQNVLT